MAKNEILPLTGIRGVAACAVMIHHANILALGENHVYVSGQLFVDLFFALSGFVIGLAYIGDGRKAVNWQSFAVARFSRIYPLHSITAAIMGLATYATFTLSNRAIPDWMTVSQLFKEITLTMAMPFFASSRAANYTAWSISVEWWTYFTAFPLLVVLGKRALKPICVVIFCAAALVLVVTLYVSTANAVSGWLAFYRSFVGFAAGYYAYLYARSNRISSNPISVSPVLTDLLVIVSFLAILASPLVFGVEAWFLILVFPVLILALSQDSGASISARIFSSKPVVYLGAISYSIYLLHPVVLSVLKLVSSRVNLNNFFTMSALTIILTVVASSICYRYVELPFKHILRPRRPLSSKFATDAGRTF